MTTFAEFIANKISVFPVHNDSKIPAVAWKRYQTDLATKEDVEEWDRLGYAVGIVTGRVSGDLQALDIDEKNNLAGKEPLIKQWSDLVKEIDPSILNKCTVQHTLSGGWHVVYRTQGTPKGNQRYASRHSVPSDGPSVRQVTLMESRGEGGYIRAYGVPDGKMKIWELQPLTDDEVETIEECARQLNEVFYEPVERKEMSKSMGNSPMDLYDAECDPSITLQLLLDNGWSITRDMGNSWQLARPGKRSGVSATLNVVPDRFYCFTSSSEFEPETVYKHSAVLAMLSYGGDYSACAKDLAKQGYTDGVSKDEASQMLDKLLGKGDKLELTTEEEAVVLGRLKTVEERIESLRELCLKGKPFVLSDRFSHLRPLMENISPGQVIGIAGSSGSGKSLIADVIMKDYANTSDSYGMSATLEMNNADTAAREAMYIQAPDEDGQVSRKEAVKNLFTNEAFRKAVIDNGSRVRTLDDCYNIDQIFAIAGIYKEYLRKQGKVLSFVSIDFQTFLEGASEIDKQSVISQKLKIYAKKLDIFVVILQQFNATVDKTDIPNSNSITGKRDNFALLDASFLIWKSKVDGRRTRIKSEKERWQLSSIVDVVANGMALHSEDYVEDNIKEVAKKLGNRSI